MMLQLVVLVVIIGILWHVRDCAKYSKYPPGPPRLPILGSILSLMFYKFPAVAIQNLSKKYGDVMHIRMGAVDMIAFTGFDTVHEILANDKTYDRRMERIPAINDRNLHSNLGIIWANGEVWRASRRFTIRSLREYGMGRATSTDSLLNEEYEKFRSDLTIQLSKSSDQVILADNLFALTVVKTVWRLVAGNSNLREAEEDIKMRKLLKTSDKLTRASNISFNAVAFPFIWDLVPALSGKTLNDEACKELRSAAKATIEERKTLGIYKSHSECFVDDFLAKIDETSHDPNSHFNELQLSFCMMDLFFGGADTPANQLSFSMVHILLHPEIQEKIQKEIDAKIEANEAIMWESRTRLPYTYAVVLESHRSTPVVPFPAFRNATEDFYFRGYQIKKGIPLLISLQGAHHSEKQWGDPHNFRPDRFLTKDGLVDTKLAGSLVSFGAGRQCSRYPKCNSRLPLLLTLRSLEWARRRELRLGNRVCLAQSMAESTQFIYFASLLRDFNFERVEGRIQPQLEPRPGLSYGSQPFHVKITPRTKAK